MKRFVWTAVLLFAMLIVACNTGEDKPASDNKNSVPVHFYNESSYTVLLYKNVNPSIYDTDAEPAANIPAGATRTIRLPPSGNAIGATFYIRYLVPLPGSDVKPVYVPTQRTINNITAVIKQEETLTIPQPKRGELEFLDGYLRIYNSGTGSLQVLKETVLLKNIADKEDRNLKSGSTGFYALELKKSGGGKQTVSGLKCTNTATDTDISIAAFELERGKVYTAECNGTAIVNTAVVEIAY